MAERSQSITDVIREDGRYPPEAFEFLNEGLARAVQEVYGGPGEGEQQRHVTGQQLSYALRDLAVEKWGLLAPTVLAKWNIHRTDDFGEMVYLMIQHDFMKKTDEDSIEDFQGVYRFEDAFRLTEDFELPQ